MGLSKYKLGELIELSEERNSDGLYGVEYVRGISNTKEIMPTKADVDEAVIKKFYIVRPGQFIYNPRTTRMGDKVGLAYNDTNTPLLFSFNNTAFSIKDSAKEIILPQYLYMLYNRSEFDRYAITNSWGSATELFTFDEMCDITITLPSIEQQRKYVDVYLALQNNLAAYQSKVEELKLVCDGYIEELRRNMKCEKIGGFITKESKNTEGRITKVLGIGQSGFIQPQKDPNESLRNYKILRKGDICYAPPLYNVLTGALHCYQGEEDAVCSPIYEVFTCNKSILIPEYLTMWLKREEFKRYAEFYAQGVRQTFDYSLMEEFEIPIPEIAVQKSISSIFKVYNERKHIATMLREQLNKLCPILIKGSLEND